MRSNGSASVPRIGRALATVALLCAPPAGAARLPQLVSPGAEVPGAVAEARCPTFSWSGVAGARGYELAILRVRDDERGDSAVVTRVTVPGDARSFTPRLDQCLERGGRYAWSVAATPGNGSGQLAWAPSHFFEVAEAPSVEDLEDALATVQRYLSAQRAESAARVAATPEDAPTRSARDSGSDDHGADDWDRQKVSRHELASLDASGDILPGALTAPTATRTLSAATAPTLGNASLTVSDQIHLAEGSDFFKAGDAFLWDDTSANTALGRKALIAATGGASQNTAIGWEALRNTSPGPNTTYGSYNTGMGYQALYANTLGRSNTATGFRALRSNTSGWFNTANGSGALRGNVAGYYNVAIGANALYSVSAARNTAVGTGALFFTTTGENNIAVGVGAGQFNNTGNNSIFIGNTGNNSDTQTIKIGTTGTQTTAFLAGDLGLGFGSGTPANRLHVRESIDDNATDPGNHVAQIENTSTGNSADVLALKVGLNHSDTGTQINGAMNFITFLDGNNSILGEIQGTTTGGIEFVSGNADFAEWLPRLDPTERIEPGDVVGLHGGVLSKRTEGATRVFVVSTAPIVTGNDPGEQRQPDFARVAFLGQAPVKVRGPVLAGDLLVASGRGDGVAIARAPDELTSAETSPIVGRALEPAAGGGTRPVLALVGLGEAPASSTSHSIERALDRLERRVHRLESSAREADAPRLDERAPTRRR